MKTVKFNFRSLALVALFSTAILAVSCNKDEEMFTPPMNASENSELKAGQALKKGENSIAAIAIGAGFTELVSALTYVDQELNAGLVNLFLNGKDQYTVFAPTNEAFTKLYSNLGVTKISDLPASLVLNVLLYHVTEGRRAANSVLPKNGTKTIETLLSGSTFSVDSKGVISAVGNQANIVTANISASNGVIHVIDEVILPIKP